MSFDLNDASIDRFSRLSMVAAALTGDVLPAEILDIVISQGAAGMGSDHAVAMLIQGSTLQRWPPSGWPATWLAGSAPSPSTPRHLDTSTPRARTAPNGPDDGGLLPLELASTVAGEVEAAVAVAGPDGVTLVAVVRVLGDGSASSP